MKDITIGALESNQRLDKFLLKYLNLSTKAFVYKMLRKKRIKLNGKKAGGNEILMPSDVLTFYISDSTIASFRSGGKIKTTGPIDIIYEDSNILIINKPANLLSHPESNNDDDTLIDRAIFYLSGKREIGPVSRPALCNRLDRNTTGIVICGKNLPSIQCLNEAIANYSIEKYYFALAQGEIDTKIELNSGYFKDTEKNLAYALPGSNNKITTIAWPSRIYKNCTLLNIQLITGKSHQIRAHLKSIGNPIIGDVKYGGARLQNFFNKKYFTNRQLLHSSKIVFKNMPSYLAYLNNKEFICRLPEDFSYIIKNIE
ncbi:MAG: RluA family pseudouridine synthase [Clostridiales bacterium]|jgi:23S rRNA pseudouridine955/2504/2580 synthase|nr:RluA family pseudouridine synthase [Clostridiales bacterium]